MMFKDLNKESVIVYIKTQTTLFPEQAELKVYEIGEGEEDGDGFINFLYRVWETGGRSVIVKQAKTYYKAFGEGEGPFVPDRNALEADILRLKYAITPEYIPQIYYIDLVNHIYICEDCGHLNILRFELMKGKSFPGLAEHIGAFIARNNFYTSEIYLDPQTHKELEAKFINPHMRKIFETGLFLKDESAFENRDPHHNPDADPIRLAMGDAPWESMAFRTEMLKLRHIHMKKSECLVHGDLHTSNIMVGGDEMKVIDMEYTYMGPLSADMGYLMGSILYEYIRWFYMPDGPGAQCEAMREYVLKLMRGILNTYVEVYTACWDADARVTYKGYDDYREFVLANWFHEMVGFTGCQIISRVGGLVPLPDFDTIADKQDQYEACRIALILANYFIMNREEVADIDDFMARIVKMTKQSRAVFQAARS
ncbi:S-methyl-5-thioribose kinase [Eubacterium barkeri]|nr:S-methyl-5-thioribose kinase [Eubacterium barkeri]